MPCWLLGVVLSLPVVVDKVLVNNRLRTVGGVPEAVCILIVVSLSPRQLLSPGMLSSCWSAFCAGKKRPLKQLKHQAA